MPWARRATKPIVSPTSTVREVEYNNYDGGVNNFVSNDVLKEGKTWQVAQDARMPALGAWETRKGCDFHSAAVGEAIDVQQTSTTGAADVDFSTTARIAKKVTFTTTGHCTRIDVNLKNTAAATGTIIVELWSNSSGAPGTLHARSSIASSDVGTSSYAYEIARYIGGASVTATDYWAVVYVQSVGTGSYKISSTTNASTGLTSSDSGTTWSAASVDFNVKAYLSTDSPSKGIFRANNSTGTEKTLLAAGTTLSSVDDSTGALTSIKTGLSASAIRYRFFTVNDTVYYCNGFDGIRKWNFSAESLVTSTNATLGVQHKGLAFWVEKDDPNKIIFSNFADYDTFTSTDFIYVPAPKTGDPITAMYPLNGVLVIWTRFNKYILYGSDNATFQLEPAASRKGTFSQETVVTDGSFAYALHDDGLYRFNGTVDQLMTGDIYEEIKHLPNKDEAVLGLSKGRLYLWYTPAAEDANSKCWVFNLNFNCVESFDTDAYINGAVTDDEGRLIVSSSLVGQAYYQELDSNDYTNLGGDINFQLATHDMIFGSAARDKEIRYWKPRFEAQSGSYTIQCQYGYDLRDNLSTQETVNVQGSGSIWGDSGTVWGSFTWGTTAELQSDLSVPGQHRRIKIGYKHYATRQPHRFLGHTFVIQVKRLR